MSTTEAMDTDTPAVGAAPLHWPPPGLELLHGAAWRAVTPLAAATLVLTAPLLFAVSAEVPFWSTGTLGSTWWVIPAAAIIGGLLALGGIARVVQMLLQGAGAVRHGHDARIVALIATDASHDAGFLLQGMRQYAALEPQERRLLMAARVVAAAGYAGALLWATAGFALGLLLAGRGIVGSGGGLTMFVVLPAVILLTPALCARVLESVATRRIRRAYRKDARAEQALRGEVLEWNAAAEERLSITPRPGSPLVARVAAAVLIITALLLPLPIVSIAGASAAGAVIGDMAVPRYNVIPTRYTRTQLLAPYTVPVDATITPLEAGQIAHALGSADGVSPNVLEVAPLRTMPPWPDRPEGMPNIALFVGTAFERLRQLTPAEIAYLESTAVHPAHAEFGRLARAGGADFMGARLDLSAVAAAHPWSIPVPRFGRLRDGAYHHVGRAVLEASRGQNQAAEETLREVISVGVLLSREGSTLVENLIGSVIAATGARALEDFYVATGRDADAAPLRALREMFDQLERTSRALAGSGNGDLRQLMLAASRPEVPRGLRWEAVMTMQVASPCLSPHSTVFGRGTEYGRWMEEMRAGLVRYPADDSLFKAVARAGLPAQEKGLLERVLGTTLAGDAARSCAALISQVADMR